MPKKEKSDLLEMIEEKNKTFRMKVEHFSNDEDFETLETMAENIVKGRYNFTDPDLNYWEKRWDKMQEYEDCTGESTFMYPGGRHDLVITIVSLFYDKAVLAGLKGENQNAI